MANNRLEQLETYILDDDAFALAYDGGWNLCVGGLFRIAGDTASNWTPTPCSW